MPDRQNPNTQERRDGSLRELSTSGLSETCDFIQSPHEPASSNASLSHHQQRDDWIGQKIAHYLVERQLGAGGMGQVFLARDLALERRVALKLLPPHFTPALRARLLEEATTSARLQHPAIATFYEAGQPDGIAFIALEYVSGQTLRDLLSQEPLSVERSIAIICCVLEALGHAHAWGILHRDIKPENIMVTSDSSAKLLDFGLGKEVQLVAGFAAPAMEEGGEQRVLTGADGLVGTPGYMSPEQLAGDAVDGRSDLFAVGAVLYEALAGRPAFPGRTISQRISATLAGAIVPLDRRDVPPPLWMAICRALSPDLAQRQPSAAALLAELRRFDSQEKAEQLEKVAILDLISLSTEEDEWMVSAMGERLERELGRIAELHVIPKSMIVSTRAALAAAGLSAAPPDLARALGSRWLLTGTLTRRADTLQLNLQLTDVAIETLVWSDDFQGAIADIFDLQRRVLQAVVVSLKRSEPADFAFQPAPATSLDAYSYYARGQRRWKSAQKGALQEACGLFEQAVALDGSYAPALAGLATVHALRFTFTTDAKALELAEDYARRALAADPMLSDAHVWLGYVLQQKRRYAEAFEHERQAMQLEPTNFIAPYFAAGCFAASHSQAGWRDLGHRICGQVPTDPHRWRRTEAVRLLQRSLDIHPRQGWAWLGLGELHKELENFVEAEWCFRKAIALEGIGQQSATVGAEGYLGESCRRAGKLPSARTCCLAGLQAIEKSDNMYRDTMRGVVLCSLGRTAIQQGDSGGAQAAYTQAIQHLRGRDRARAAGHPLVQALAGLSRATSNPQPLAEALDLFHTREGFDFSFMWGCTDDATLMDLYRAALHVGPADRARDLLEQAMDAGSTEAHRI